MAQPPVPITNAVAISAGGTVNGYGIALLDNGRVVGWGSSFFLAASPPASLTNAVQISASVDHAIALRSNGEVVCWGANSQGQTDVPPGITNAIAVAAGEQFSLAVLSDGTVCAWGKATGYSGHTNLNGIVAVSAGFNHSIALKTNGTVVAFGTENGFGQMNVPPTLSGVTAISAARSFNLALRTNGTVVSWSSSAGLPHPSVTNAIAIAAGTHGAAILKNNRLVTWRNGTLSFHDLVQSNFLGVAFTKDTFIGIPRFSALTRQPVIHTQPVGLTASPGNFVLLSLEAYGATPVSLQWRRNGTNLPGETGFSIVFTNIQTLNSGSYSVFLTNAGGSITSSVATVSITTNPAAASIYKQPVSRTALVGQTISFEAGATGSEPLSYQWFFDGRALPDETNRIITLPDVSEIHAGPYIVRVTNQFGGGNSAQAFLTVNQPPVITTPVTVATWPPGTNAVLTASVSGTSPISGQWQLNGTDIDGATNVSMVLTDFQLSDVGDYAFVASSPYGVVSNVLYSLSIQESPPVIYEQPVSREFLPDSDVALFARALGSGPLHIEWTHDGFAIPGATNLTLELIQAGTNDSGIYRVSVSNHLGFALSDEAVLSVGDPHDGAPDWPVLAISRAVTNDFLAPTGIIHAGDGTGRLFVLEQHGKVRIVQSNAVHDQPFLNISNRVFFWTEMGLIGMAFSPGYSTNGRFYVAYSSKPNGDTRLSRFAVTTTNANSGDPDSEEILLSIPQPFGNHKAGHLAFGPDGYLYMAVGDGGYDGTIGDPLTNAQNKASLLGKILRLDVETGAVPYAIPADNPFVGTLDAAPEIWAYGLRNPWRFSFDRLTGDLFIADVGHANREEVNFEPAGSEGGRNYGWRIMEGDLQYIAPPGFTNFGSLTPPVLSLPWGSGSARGIIGGYVYRGPYRPRMNEVYVFGDFANGRLSALRRQGSNWQSGVAGVVTNIISTLGEDESGRLYIASYDYFESRRGILFAIDELDVPFLPSINPNGASVSQPLSVTLNCQTPGTTIRYTTDGRDPSEFDLSVPAGGTVTLDGSCILKVRAFRSDLEPSPVVSAIFSFTVATPFMTPAAGPITNGTTITIGTETTNAVIRYTLDNSQPNLTSEIYTGPFEIPGNTTVRARAYKPGYSSSGAAGVHYPLPMTATPLMFPPPSPITNSTSVSITCSTPGAQIYFTTNETPASTNSQLYSSPVVINGNSILRTMAWSPDHNPSDVTGGFYPHAAVATPQFTPTSGDFTNGTMLVITCATEGAIVRFTTNGIAPTTNSAVYSNPILLTASLTVMARAFADGHADSAVQSGSYLLWIPDPTVVTTLAGAGQVGLVNGPAADALFNNPQGLTVDSGGNVYVADTGNNVIRRIGTNGLVTTIAGKTSPGFLDGTSTNAQFNQPIGVCFGPDGHLYVADRQNFRIRRVTLDGVVSTYAGAGSFGAADGPLLSASLGTMSHLSSDPHGNLYVGSSGVVRKIGTNGFVSTITNSSLNMNNDVSAAPDESGVVYIVSSSIHMTRFSQQTGVALHAGSGNAYEDGPRLTARFPVHNFVNRGITIDAFGHIYFTDPGRIRRLSPDGTISTFAGRIPGFQDGPGPVAQFNQIAGIAVDGAQVVYVADVLNHRIRKIFMDADADGIPDGHEGGASVFTPGVDDRLVDSDGDGMSNAAEFRAGTNPQDNASFLAVDSISILVDGRPQVQWQSVAGRRYQVKTSTDFQSWTNLGSILLGNGSILSVIDPSVGTAGERFFRVFLID